MGKSIKNFGTLNAKNPKKLGNWEKFSCVGQPNFQGMAIN